MLKNEVKKDNICRCSDGSLYKKRCPFADHIGKCGLPSSEGWNVKCPGEKNYR